ncbi:beta-lactamase/transpeptidase-like protein [Melanogaster broomeanus]|nr:beta-lactamase/transpeptidase-like protein [Melanogaster broomeanus]
MYTVGTHIIATYAGKPYTSFVEERIFSPLGMTSSTFPPEQAGSSGKFSQGWTKGPGAVISSAVDMSKWVAMWLNEGVHGDKALIPPSVYQELVIRRDSEHSIVGYGMGWFRSSYRGHDVKAFTCLPPRQVVYHVGGILGFTALVSFLPSDAIGVTVLSNGDEQAKPVVNILNRILDEALHLDSSLTLSSPALTTLPLPNPPSNPAPGALTVSLTDLAGTYTNTGYSTLTLCAPSTASSYCAKVHSDFTAVDYAQGNSEPSLELLAEWPRIESSHIRMRYQQGFIFNIDFTALFPDGYGKDETPFETGDIERPDATAEFVIEDGQVVGFGLSGLEGWLWERARISHSCARSG